MLATEWGNVRYPSCREKGRMWGRVGAWCMTFRHRHFSLSRLIETAEVEPGKAETAERKRQGVRRMKVQSDTRTAHAADDFWFPASLSSKETTVFPHVLQ